MSVYSLNRTSWKLYFLVALIMCSINFFELQIVKGSFVRYIQFGYLLAAIAISVPYMFPKRKAFVTPVQLLFFSAFISIFTATFTWDQSLIDSLGGTAPFMVCGCFFYLYYNQSTFPVATIEKIVVGYGILYLILYFFQFTHPETAYFIKLDTIDYERGILRIVFPGRGLFYLTSFIAITKVNATRKNIWLWRFLSVAGIVVTVMQVTRQFIFGAVVIYLIHFLKDVGIFPKLIIVVLFAGVVLFISQSDNPIVAAMKDTQEQTQESGTDYIRVQEAIFFLTDFSQSFANRILGNGEPYGENSPYNKYYGWLLGNYGYWLTDVGIVGVYAMFGVFAVLGYVLIWVKSFTLKLPKKYFYLKYYLWFLIMTGFTSDTIYSTNDLIATVLVLYLYQIIYEKQKQKISIPILPVRKILSHSYINRRRFAN